MIIVTTPVQMTDEDARKFLLFQKYYDVFKILDEKGAFEVKFGKVTMNFAFGNLQNVVKEEIVYKA